MYKLIHPTKTSFIFRKNSLQRAAIRLTTIALFLSQVGCGGGIYEYITYDNPNQSDAEVAILHVPRSTLVEAIDGKGRYHPGYTTRFFPYKGARIALLPGRHTAMLHFKVPTWYATTEPVEVEFHVQGGKSYIVEPFVGLRDNVRYVTFSVKPYKTAGSEKPASSGR